MDIPVKSNQVWAQLINGKLKYNFEFLGLQILLGRLTVKYQNEPTDENLVSCIDELVSFFEKTKHIPVSQKDLKKAFSIGG